MTDELKKFNAYLEYKEKWKKEAIDWRPVTDFIIEEDLAYLCEALKAENERLRIALKKISIFSIGQGSSVRNYTEGYLDIKDIAIQALEGK